MKINNGVILLLFFISTSFFVCAQTHSHSTINALEVSYKESTLPADSVILYRSQSEVTFKSDSNIVMIHFKIIKESDASIIYQVDYATNLPVIINNEGIILFKKKTSACYIASAIEIPLSVYRYQITTEDAHGNITEVYQDYK